MAKFQCPEGFQWTRMVASRINASPSEAFDIETALETSEDTSWFTSLYHHRTPACTLIGRSGPNRAVSWLRAMPDKIEIHDGFFRSVEVDPSEVQQRIDALTWEHVGLGTVDVSIPADLRVPDLENLLTQHSGAAMWLIEASPVGLEKEPDIDALNRVIQAGDVGTTQEQDEAARATRLRELLQRVAPQGLWRLRLHAGAMDAASARALLGSLQSIAGLRNLDYSLGPVRGSGSAVDVVPTSALAALGRTPVVEVRGFRVHRSARWDMEPEVLSGKESRVHIGKVVNDFSTHEQANVSVPLSAINRHVFVTGATGSGKSQTVRALLRGLSQAQIPWLVIEPAKSEYQAMAGQIDGEVSLLRVGGDLSATSLGLNPLEPTSVVGSGDSVPTTFSLATHVAMLRELFSASFTADEPFPQIVSLALERSYSSLGWDVASGQAMHGHGPLSYPSLRELRNSALQVVDDLGYGREVADNVRGMVDVRLNSLRQGAAGLFFEGGHPIDLDALRTKNVVLQIEDLGNEQDQAFLIGVFLIRWVEMLRMRGDAAGELRHVIVIEEAHRLLRNSTDNSAKSIEYFANLIAETRSYGQGVVVAEQIPSKVIPDVVKNSAVKIVHRLPAQDDRDFVGATMNLDGLQSKEVVALQPGAAAFHSNGMDYPIKIQVAAMTPPDSGYGNECSLEVRSSQRGPGCSENCQEDRCTTEELYTSSRLAEEPKFSAWVDLSVTAAITGHPMPIVGQRVVSHWLPSRGGSERLRCAIGLAVEASVSSRIMDISPFFASCDLVSDLSTYLYQVCIEGSPSTQMSSNWQVGEYRFIDLAVDLEKFKMEGGTSPHPKTSEWLAQRNLDLGLSPVDQQIQTLISVHRSLQTVPHRRKFWGEPSILERSMRMSGWQSTSELAEVLDLDPASRRWMKKRLDEGLLT